MLKFWKKFRYFALGAVVLQFGGCGINGLFSGLLENAVSYAALEFLTDNNGIFDLFTDS
jgi:hypothetical protein